MEKIELTPDMKLKRNEDDFLFTEVDGEAVVMHTKTGRYIGLNSVTTDIWEIVKEEIEVGDIINKLLEMYDVEREKCENDTFPMLKRMVNSKLVHVV